MFQSISTTIENYQHTNNIQWTGITNVMENMSIISECEKVEKQELEEPFYVSES